MSRAVRLANAKARQSIFGHFFNLFGMFCEISGPLSHAAYRNVHNCGPFSYDTWTSEPCGILKGPQFFKKVKNLSKKGPKSQMPPLGDLIKNIPVSYP